MRVLTRYRPGVTLKSDEDTFFSTDRKRKQWPDSHRIPVDDGGLGHRVCRDVWVPTGAVEAAVYDRRSEDLVHVSEIN